MQIQRGAEFLRRRYGAESFILYFQAFSSTFGTLQDLKALYDYGLSVMPFRELVISTRPDCIDEDIVALLESYCRKDFDVWIELGLQSASDRTLTRIHRGHTVGQLKQAYDTIKSTAIKRTMHVIFGLPGEGRREIMETVSLIRDLHPHGIKIHDLHIPKKTALHEELLRGELSLPCMERHLQYVITALEYLPEDIVMMRFTCDTPDRSRAFPLSAPSKGSFYEALRLRMEHQNTWQGRLCN